VPGRPLKGPRTCEQDRRRLPRFYHHGEPILHRALPGRVPQAIQYGLRSLDLRARSFSHSNELAAYANLAEAYLLSGDDDEALKCWERAATRAARHLTWRTSIEFSPGERDVRPRPGKSPLSPGTNRVSGEGSMGSRAYRFRARHVREAESVQGAHVSSPESATAIATKARARFRGRHPSTI